MKTTFLKFYNYFKSAPNSKQKEKGIMCLLKKIYFLNGDKLKMISNEKTKGPKFDCKINNELIEVKSFVATNAGPAFFEVSVNQLNLTKNFIFFLILVSKFNLFICKTNNSNFKKMFKVGKFKNKNNKKCNNSPSRNQFKCCINKKEIENIDNEKDGAKFKPILNFFNNDFILVKETLNKIIKNNPIQYKFKQTDFNFGLLGFDSYKQSDYFNQILKNSFNSPNFQYNYEFETKERIDLILTNKKTNEAYNIEIKVSIIRNNNQFHFKALKKSDNKYYNKDGKIDYYLTIGYTANETYLKLFQADDFIILDVFKNNNNEFTDFSKSLIKFINLGAIQIQTNKNEYNLQLISNYITNFLQNSKF